MFNRGSALDSQQDLSPSVMADRAMREGVESVWGKSGGISSKERRALVSNILQMFKSSGNDDTFLRNDNFNRLPCFESIAEQTAELICCMLEVNAEKRPKAAEVLECLTKLQEQMAPRLDELKIVAPKFIRADSSLKIVVRAEGNGLPQDGSWLNITTEGFWGKGKSAPEGLWPHIKTKDRLRWAIDLGRPRESGDCKISVVADVGGQEKVALAEVMVKPLPQQLWDGGKYIDALKANPECDEWLDYIRAAAREDRSRYQALIKIMEEVYRELGADGRDVAFPKIGKLHYELLDMQRQYTNMLEKVVEKLGPTVLSPATDPYWREVDGRISGQLLNRFVSAESEPVDDGCSHNPGRDAWSWGILVSGIICVFLSGAVFGKIVDAYGDKTVSVDGEAKPEPDGFPLNIMTAPANASADVVLYKLMGQYAPDMHYPAGKYWYVASAKGFETQGGWLKVVNGTVAKTVELKASKATAEKKKRTNEKNKRVKYPLTIETVPHDAKVRILKIRPKYKDGILLKPGMYIIEVSHPGYEKFEEKREVGPDKGKYKITLKKQKKVFDSEKIEKQKKPQKNNKTSASTKYVMTPAEARANGKIFAEIKRDDFENIAKLTYIEPEFAEIVAVNRHGDIDLSGLRSLDRKSADQLSKFKGNRYRDIKLNGLKDIDSILDSSLKDSINGFQFNGLKSLTIPQARKLAKWSASSLSFNGIEMLDENVLSVLVEGRASLFFDGLKKLSPELCREFAKCRGEALSLRGVDILSPADAQQLSAAQVGIMWLGVQVLSDNVTNQLGQWRGYLLSFPKLRALSEHSAAVFSGMEVNNFDFDKLKRLPPKVAKNLFKESKGVISLNGLEDLEEGAALEMAKWNGRELHLNGLKSVSPGAARRLKRCMVTELHLYGLEDPAPQTADELIEIKDKIKTNVDLRMRVSD